MDPLYPECSIENEVSIRTDEETEEEAATLTVAASTQDNEEVTETTEEAGASPVPTPPDNQPSATAEPEEPTNLPSSVGDEETASTTGADVAQAETVTETPHDAVLDVEEIAQNTVVNENEEEEEEEPVVDEKAAEEETEKAAEVVELPPSDAQTEDMSTQITVMPEVHEPPEPIKVAIERSGVGSEIFFDSDNSEVFLTPTEIVNESTAAEKKDSQDTVAVVDDEMDTKASPVKENKIKSEDEVMCECNGYAEGDEEEEESPVHEAVAVVAEPLPAAREKDEVTKGTADSDMTETSGSAAVVSAEGEDTADASFESKANSDEVSEEPVSTKSCDEEKTVLEAQQQEQAEEEIAEPVEEVAEVETTEAEDKEKCSSEVEADASESEPYQCCTISSVEGKKRIRIRCMQFIFRL